ncbi:methionine ABC transporter ATP-binding protein [Metallumcola ferriviriculae]|uniref:Methionine ABC transporter ATP-binding protein n=1 Tax=Metallumcola ferriviriculae TaxID=3039180 RepID=A0AAU0UT53_9FIRM|nr:methionine ABC transporter ATP-binding protein [Desulfitibacteraceae bacterium MK1]
MITLKNIHKVFDTGKAKIEALKGVDLTIDAGEVYGIIGLSGAGKSTLVRCINMLEQPTTGEVIVDEQDFTKLDAKELRMARRKIGMIFQHFNLLWSRTVYGNIAFPLEIAGVPNDKIRPKVLELLRLVALEDKVDSYPAQLSGGQKQRVGIARALANDPTVLLCDEATSALDPDTTAAILRLLQDINQKLNLTIVVITHEMHVIKQICDRVAVIDDGKVIEEGPVIDIFTNPVSAVTRRFINSVVKTEVPQVIKDRQIELQSSGDPAKIIRISFIGQAAGEPVISQLVKDFHVRANVLYGNIDHIKETIYGTLTLELTGESEALEQALSFLQQQNLQTEVLHHV